MKHFEKCPVCGGDLAEKQAEKSLKGGDNAVAVKMPEINFENFAEIECDEAIKDII